MSARRSGANHQWEWQLVRAEGNVSDIGLRQRRMVMGIDSRARKERDERKAKKKQLTLLDLKGLFLKGEKK